MLSAQDNQDFPITNGSRSSGLALANVAIAITAMTNQGRGKTNQTLPSGMPGRDRRMVSSTAEIAMASGNASLIQNMGSAAACDKSWRTP